MLIAVTGELLLVEDVEGDIEVLDICAEVLMGVLLGTAIEVILLEGADAEIIRAAVSEVVQGVEVLEDTRETVVLGFVAKVAVSLAGILALVLAMEGTVALVSAVVVWAVEVLVALVFAVVVFAVKTVVALVFAVVVYAVEIVVPLVLVGTTALVFAAEGTVGVAFAAVDVVGDAEDAVVTLGALEMLAEEVEVLSM